MFCSKCGTSFADGAAACPKCGASTAAAAQPGAPSPVAAAPAPGWQGVPQPQRYSGPQQTDGKAVASLVLGIFAIFPLGLLAGIPAVVLGHLSKSSIARSMGRLKGDGMATAGLIMGYVSVAFVPLVLIIAAIAIPNLLRAKIAANESAAASTVRTVNTAQLSYATNYPSGYAPSLAVLGPGESPVNCSDPTKIDAQHACLIESVLACSETWCTKGGYKYNLTAICGNDGNCANYVTTATPVAPGSTGTKSFCATSDGIIRVHRSGPVLRPLTVEECQEWPMVQ